MSLLFARLVEKKTEIYHCIDVNNDDCSSREPMYERKLKTFSTVKSRNYHSLPVILYFTLVDRRRHLVLPDPVLQ